MKKILSILTVACFAFTSCSSEDESSENTNQESNIQGSYEITSILQNGQTIPFDDCGDQELLIFDTNNYGRYIDFIGDNCETQADDIFTYSINDSTLNLTFEDNDSDQVEIITLNSTTLELESIEIDNDGNTVITIEAYRRL